VATLARHLWLVELLGYDYEIKYKKGKENVVAGSLSRISCSDLYALVVSTVSTSIMEEIKKSWEKESSIQATIQGLQVSSNSHPYYIWVNNCNNPAF
jgi:ribosomal protein L31